MQRFYTVARKKRDLDRWGAEFPLAAHLYWSPLATARPLQG